MLRFSLLAAVLCVGCGGASDQSAPAARIEPGEEPLETANLGDEEVVPLEPEKIPLSTEGRPCAWARAWRDPHAPKPLFAGLGGVPNPARVSDSPISLPARDPAPSRDIVVEIVVSPDGSVGEASVVRTTEPPWPDAEERILEAVRQWRYEPTSFEGTPIAVCTTVSIRP